MYNYSEKYQLKNLVTKVINLSFYSFLQCMCVTHCRIIKREREISNCYICLTLETLPFLPSTLSNLKLLAKVWTFVMHSVQYTRTTLESKNYYFNENHSFWFHDYLILNILNFQLQSPTQSVSQTGDRIFSVECRSSAESPMTKQCHTESYAMKATLIILHFRLFPNIEHTDHTHTHGFKIFLRILLFGI